MIRQSHNLEFYKFFITSEKLKILDNEKIKEYIYILSLQIEVCLEELAKTEEDSKVKILIEKEKFNSYLKNSLEKYED